MASTTKKMGYYDYIFIMRSRIENILKTVKNDGIDRNLLVFEATKGLKIGFSPAEKYIDMLIKIGKAKEEIGAIIWQGD